MKTLNLHQRINLKGIIAKQFGCYSTHSTKDKLSTMRVEVYKTDIVYTVKGKIGTYTHYFDNGLKQII